MRIDTMRSTTNIARHMVNTIGSEGNRYGFHIVDGTSQTDGGTPKVIPVEFKSQAGWPTFISEDGDTVTIKHVVGCVQQLDDEGVPIGVFIGGEAETLLTLKRS